MLKKTVVGISFILVSHIALADTCPTVHAIKHSPLPEWSLYDSEDGSKLSSDRVNHFKHAVKAFVLAEWSQAKSKDSIHCYYRDQSGSNLEAYLSKEHLHPKQMAHHFWYPVSGHMHCAASSIKCEFEGGLAKQQLASR